MTEQGSKYLTDILIAIDLIEEFTIEVTCFDDYNLDPKTQSAVERQLVIIGEALNKFKKSNLSLPLSMTDLLFPLEND